MIFTFFIAVSLVALLIASYTDIKTLEVPDYLSYSLIAIGIGANIIYSTYYSDPLFILRSILGFFVAWLLGIAMFYTGQWGGGDSKVLFGLGALLGFDYPIELGFFAKFLVNMLFAGAFYGILWIIVMYVKNREAIAAKLKIELKQKKLARIRLYSGIGAVLCLAAVYFLPAIFIPQAKITLAILICFLYFTNYLFVFVRSVEKIAMVKLIPPEKLTEGDWIVDEIKVDGKYITGPKDLGIEKSKILELIKFKRQGKISKLRVKYGIPFVPSFLIALIITIITNDVLFFAFLN